MEVAERKFNSLQHYSRLWHFKPRIRYYYTLLESTLLCTVGKYVNFHREIKGDGEEDKKVIMK